MKRARLVIKYDLDSYDKHGCLKVPLLLFAVLVFACREYLLPLLTLISSIRGGSSYDVSLLLDEHHKLALITELPALLTAYALSRRVPAGDAFARWIWRRGQIFVAVSVLLDVYLATVVAGFSFRHLADGSILPLLRLAADASILACLALSTRIKDTFADFPVRAVVSAGASSR